MMANAAGLLGGMMPTFIERNDDPQIPPPYDLSGITVRSFELAADMTALTSLCNKLLNIDSLDQRGFQYRPVLPYVALEVLTYERMISTVAPYSGMGFIQQNEIYFRMIVCRFDRIGPFLVPVMLYNFFPFIVVDNAWSAFSGREVLGLPKAIGMIDQKPSNVSYTATLKLPVFKTFSPTTPQTMQQVISIQTGKLAALAPSGALTWPWVAFGEQGLGLSPQQVHLADLIDPLGFSTVHLKQLRDAGNATEACYQALVTANFSVTTVTPYNLLESATVTLFPTATIDIAQTFGLASSGTLRAALAYQVRCGLTFGDVCNQFVLS